MFASIGVAKHLSFLLTKYRTVLSKGVFATQNAGDPPAWDNYEERASHNLLRDCESFFESPCDMHPVQGWICNVDLDYFFCRATKEGVARTVHMFSYEYVKHLFTVLKDAIDGGQIAVFTMALSPECCGGWVNAENLAYEVCDIMDIPFRLPPAK